MAGSLFGMVLPVAGGELAFVSLSAALVMLAALSFRFVIPNLLQEQDSPL